MSLQDSPRGAYHHAHRVSVDEDEYDHDHYGHSNSHHQQLINQNDMMEDDDDEDDINQALMLDNDPYQSSSPSINEEEIDFQYVYALRTFNATEQGQANALKGDAMILLNDTNSYWWLVRLVKDSTVGFLPAEHIETPSERLARLNKHRNSEFCSPASFSYSANNSPDPNNNNNSQGFASSFNIRKHKTPKPKKKKSVTFTPTLTYVSASEYEYSDADEADVEDIGDSSDDDENAEESAEQHEQHTIISNVTNSQPENQSQTSPLLAQKQKMDPLVIHKPRSNPNLREQSEYQHDFNTNSDEDDLDVGRRNIINKPRPVHSDPNLNASAKMNHNQSSNASGETDSFRRRSSSTGAISGGNSNSGISLLSRLSRGMNRRHSNIPGPTREVSEPLENGSSHANSGSTATAGTAAAIAASVAAFNNASQDDESKQARRRSLLKTKSSIEHLKSTPASNVDSMIPSPNTNVNNNNATNTINANNDNNNSNNGSNNNSGIAGLFKRSRKGSVSNAPQPSRIPQAVRPEQPQPLQTNISPSATSSISSTSPRSSPATSPEVAEPSKSFKSSSSLVANAISQFGGGSARLSNTSNNLPQRDPQHNPLHTEIEHNTPTSQKFYANSTAPLNFPTSNIKDRIENDNNNTITPTVSAEKPASTTSTTSSASTTSLPSDISDRDTRSGSAATMSTVPSSPSFLEESGDDAPSGKGHTQANISTIPSGINSNQAEFGLNVVTQQSPDTPDDANNTFKNTNPFHIPDTHNVIGNNTTHSTISTAGSVSGRPGNISPTSVTLPLQVSPSKKTSISSLNSLGSAASVGSSSTTTAGSSGGVKPRNDARTLLPVYNNASPKNNYGINKNIPDHNTISESSSSATVSALIGSSPVIDPSNNVGSILATPPKLHPEIAPIYQDTILKLDRMGSRIDALLLKYSSVASTPIIP